MYMWKVLRWSEIEEEKGVDAYHWDMSPAD